LTGRFSPEERPFFAKSMSAPNCKICQQPTRVLWEKLILSRHKISYFHCASCGFVSTENPFWLDEAYAEAIADMDTGIMERNLKQRAVVPLVIRWYFNTKAKFVDFGAGYGIFVRLMRDKGFDFYWTDKYAQNLFARKFIARLPEPGAQKFELLTAFEVMEHMPEPEQALDEMLEWSDSILFTTLMLPASTANGLHENSDWWYWTYETGQHVSLYTEKSLAFLAQKKGLSFHSNGKNLHLMTRKKGGFALFWLMRILFFIRDAFRSGSSTNRADRELYKPESTPEGQPGR
jgi:hypothetical protein